MRDKLEGSDIFSAFSVPPRQERPQGRLVVANAFSLSMLGEIGRNLLGVDIRFRQVPKETVVSLLEGRDFLSVVGHPGTAEVFSAVLGVRVPANRAFFQLGWWDTLIVGSLDARLPEGKVLTAEELQGLPIRWWLVYASQGEG